MKLVTTLIQLVPISIPNEEEMSKQHIKKKIEVNEAIVKIQLITYREIFKYQNYFQ
jgi:hypothetical protein